MIRYNLLTARRCRARHCKRGRNIRSFEPCPACQRHLTEPEPTVSTTETGFVVRLTPGERAATAAYLREQLADCPETLAALERVLERLRREAGE